MANSLNLYFMQPPKLGQPGSVERILELVNREFDIPHLHVWTLPADKNPPIKVEASWEQFDERVIEEIDLVYRVGELYLIATERERRGGVVFHIELRLPVASGSTKRKQEIRAATLGASMFRKEEFDAAHNSLIMLDFARRLYYLTEPPFGWLDICNASGYTAKNDLENLNIPHLYWANFFSPPFVEKYGADYFQNAPGWKKEMLEDGGFLYVVAPHLGRSQKGTKAFEKEVKDYFEAESVRIRPKHPKKKKSTRTHQRLEERMRQAGFNPNAEGDETIKELEGLSGKEFAKKLTEFLISQKFDQ